MILLILWLLWPWSQGPTPPLPDQVPWVALLTYCDEAPCFVETLQIRKIGDGEDDYTWATISWNRMLTSSTVDWDGQRIYPKETTRLP